MSDTEDNMKRLSAMAVQLRAAKATIADLQTKLDTATATEARLETEAIPTLMTELEMKEFTLLDGTKIEVTDDLKCSITVANRQEAHKWLRSKKLGGVIKTLLNQQYEAGELAQAEANAKAIAELTGRPTHVVESVHPGTLKALLKEQRAKGVKIPVNLFGLFPFSKAKVTPPKQ